MTRKRKLFLLILAAVLLLLAGSAVVWRLQNAVPRKPGEIMTGDYSYTLEYAEYEIRQLMKQRHLPSVAVALIDDQSTVWQETFGLVNVKTGKAATVDTVYKLWSVSKVFTAIEMMRLVEEGLVDLDAPIADTLPAFSIQSRFQDETPITIRSILTHRSGLPRNGCYQVGGRPGDPGVLDGMMHSLKDCLMAFPVGYRYKYSNIGPDLLGAIIEEVRAISYPIYIKENLLAPVGMENSAFLSSGIPAGRQFALGYEYWEGDYYPLEQSDIINLPSGNLYSTIEDMSKFVKFILRGGQAGGDQIIQAETLALMFAEQPILPRDPQPMGLGWKTARVFGAEKLVWHDGGPSEGIGALVALLPERKLGVVLFANEISFDGSMSVALAIDILQQMLEAKYGIDTAQEPPPLQVEVDDALLDNYSGKYIAFGEPMEVYRSGDGLKGEIQGMKFDLVAVGQTKFMIDHWLLKLGLADLLQLPIDLRQLEIEFLVDANAEDTLMIIGAGDIFYEICTRYTEIAEIPVLLELLSSEYNIYERLPSGYAGAFVGTDEIKIENGVLMMPGVIGPLKPISETEIIILSGPFAGETMVFDPASGEISHQSYIYKPAGR